MAEPLRERHADPRAKRCRETRVEGRQRPMGREATAKIGASVESGPSISPLRAGWTRWRAESAWDYSSSSEPATSREFPEDVAHLVRD